MQSRGEVVSSETAQKRPSNGTTTPNKPHHQLFASPVEGHHGHFAVLQPLAKEPSPRPQKPRPAPMKSLKAGLVRRVPSSQLLGAKPGSFVKTVPSRQLATAPPPDADDEELVLCQRAASCPAALPPFAAWSPPLLLQSVADELVTESALHVSAVQRMQCVHSGYNVQVSAVSAAPSLVARPQAGGVSAVSDDSRAVAACYAMPPDNAVAGEEAEFGQGQGGSAAAAHVRALQAPSRAPGAAAEGLLSLQQRSALAAGEYTNELLAAAASARRQRKRAVLRALRTSRNLATKLSMVLLSLGSLDDDEKEPTLTKHDEDVAVPSTPTMLAATMRR